MRIDDFEAMISVATDECIEWPYNRNRDGYGYVLADGQSRGVHELACERTHGPKPGGMVAAHVPELCHNASCFNPRHVRWATQRENLADRVIDRTANRGERHGRAKLTSDAVRDIRARRAAGQTQLAVAAAHGVARSTICAIDRRVRWGWLT